MNKFIYFTSAMDDNSFEEYLKKWSVSPNLSNQNFHNKLIHALALNHDIDVISVRSINKNYKEKKLKAKIVKEDNIFWKYPYVSTSKVSKYLKLFKRIKEITFPDSELVLVDVLNLSLLKNAIKYAKKYKIKIVGIVTDSPNNISFISKRYKKKLFKLGRSLNGYIVLTDKLNELYNLENRPFIKIDGVSLDIKEYLPREINDDYIYFGGSLMKEYGVYNLIDAFNELKEPKLKLVLCGHHVSLQTLKKHINKNKNIIYKGPVAYNENLSLEKYSLLAVNPRPINENIDDCSIPSKTIEFLANGVLTVTVENKLLKEHYGDSIIWAKSGDAKDLLEAMKVALSLKKDEKEKLTIEGKNKAMKYTSLKNVNNQINKELLPKVFLD